MHDINLFKGTGVALVTPFRNNVVDFEALGNIIEYVIAGGVDYLICLGTTGEAVTQTMEECLDVKRFTVRQVAGRKPIVFGLFGGSYTERIKERLKHYDLTGIHALLSSSPNYIKPTQEGIYRHYMEIAEASPLPIIVYNVPSRTASNIEANTIIRLANDSPNIIGIKEASGDMYQGAVIKAGSPDPFLLLSGDDLTTMPLIACGGHGVISVIANAFPASFSQMVRAANQGDFEKARYYNTPLLNMYKWIFVEGNPSGIKYVLHHLGLCSDELRIPLLPLSAGARQAMHSDMKKALEFEKQVQHSL
jgi:4-hydroxy-tetrahydrodipicolinate synthase